MPDQAAKVASAGPARNTLDRAVLWLATGGHSGHSPIVPATVGSAVGLVLFLPLAHASLSVQTAPTILLLFLGVWIAGRAEDLSGVKDARPIVIDEVVGMWISLLALPPRMEYWLAAFVLFRVFDVVKPFPADRAQRLARGWGIMLDDVFAGIYANAVLHLFIQVAQ